MFQERGSGGEAAPLQPVQRNQHTIRRAQWHERMTRASHADRAPGRVGLLDQVNDFCFTLGKVDALGRASDTARPVCPGLWHGVFSCNEQVGDSVVRPGHAAREVYAVTGTLCPCERTASFVHILPAGVPVTLLFAQFKLTKVQQQLLRVTTFDQQHPGPLLQDFMMLLNFVEEATPHNFVKTAPGWLSPIRHTAIRFVKMFAA